ncbi:hypothetical protein IMZ48_04920 [Candidatus Bathyarchaeota archaeon]|nr:hypothetical protein [Candidatus Bathyarchaeota archaeon]
MVYYIRRCLHDYADDDAVRILQHIRAVMVPDSRCLIVEQVMSNPPSAMAAASDILMGMQGGKERTLEGFRDVASRAGLELRKAHPAGVKSDVAIIECALA